MNEWMDESAEWVGGMMGYSIMGCNAKWQQVSERMTRQEAEAESAEQQIQREVGACGGGIE